MLNHSVQLEEFAKGLWGDLWQESPRLQQASDKNPNIMQDVWGAHFEVAPHLLPPDTLSPEAKASHAIVQGMMQSPAYQDLHQWTQYDTWLSALAACEFGERMQVEERRLRGKGLGEKGKALGDAAGAVIGQVAEQVGDAIAVLNGLGYSEHGMGQQPTSVQAKTLQYLQGCGNLKRMAQLLGQGLPIAQQVLRKSKAGKSSEIWSVSTGNDLARITPTEWAGFAHKTTRLDFLKRYSDKQLTQYQGRKALGKGAMVICVDSSGSTAHIREHLSSIALGYAQIAQDDKRDCAVLFYAGVVEAVRAVHLKAGERRPDKLLEIASHYIGGGTSWMAALNAARDAMKDNYKRADVVLITDGECHEFTGYTHTGRRRDDWAAWVERFNAERRTKGFQVHGILVNTSAENAEQMRPCVDDIRFVDTNQTDPSQLFRLVT